MELMKSIMLVTMTAYSGSQLSEFLIPPDVVRKDGVPWWLMKQGRGRGPRRGNRRGTFNRSGSRKK